MRRINADKSGLTRQRQRFDVATDVASGQTNRAQRRTRHMSEVLADASSLSQHRMQWRGDIAEGGVELELVEDAVA